MNNQILGFLRQYPVLAVVSVAIIAGLALQLSGLGELTNWILIAGSAIATYQIVRDMIDTVRKGGLGLDILALTAIVVGVALGEYWTAIVISLMLTGGQALEDYAERRATNELTALLERAPTRAHIINANGSTHDVRIEKVAVGDQVLVKPGEVIPVDGKIIDGTTNVDESSLTGESLPVTKQPGQEVLSGTVTIDAAISIQALRTSDQSQYAQIIKLVREATTSKSPFVRLADRYSLPFTAVSFAIAGVAWAVSGEIVRFLEVIVVATPCPLLIGAPIAIISGMSRAAKHGIIIKNGSSLERLAAVRSVAFDKTGTLTRGKPVLQSVEAYQNISDDQLLALVASIEAQSAHILAASVTKAAKQKGLDLPAVRNVSEVPGLGIRAEWNNKHVRLGNQEFLRREGISLPTNHTNDQTQMSTFIAIDGKLVGALHFTDQIRPEAKQTIEDLRREGIGHILMLTGDNSTVAQAIAKQAGITEVHAGLLPADKVKTLKNIDPSYRPSGMVGDGVNDAPVLAASDVGVALGARGSTAASESADVVIMLDNLRKVAQAVSIAKNTIRIGLQSIWIGISISVGLMLVFSTGKFPAVLGAGLQEVVDVVVIFNALRAHGQLGQTLLAKVRR